MVGDKLYLDLKKKLVQVVSDYVKEAGGMSFDDLAHLLGDGEVYDDLFTERVIFCEPETEKSQPGQER